MKNINKEDFVFWNTETKKPIEPYDIVYHYTTIIEMLNMDGINLPKNVEIVSVASLNITEQIKYSIAIEQTK